jgi:hypothetical protein
MLAQNEAPCARRPAAQIRSRRPVRLPLHWTGLDWTGGAPLAGPTYLRAAHLAHLLGAALGVQARDPPFLRLLRGRISRDLGLLRVVAVEGKKKPAVIGARSRAGFTTRGNSDGRALSWTQRAAGIHWTGASPAMGHFLFQPAVFLLLERLYLYQALHFLSGVIGCFFGCWAYAAWSARRKKRKRE